MSKVLPNKPIGKARVAPLSLDKMKDKGNTAAAVMHAAYTWGQGSYFPNNLIKTMAHCPRLAQTEVAYANSFIFDESANLNGVQQAGFIDRCLKEIVITLVALKNRARYSVTHHSLISYLTYQSMGREQEYLPKFLHLHEFKMYRENYTDLEFAILVYTEKICDDPHLILDSEFDELKLLLAQYNLGNSPDVSVERNNALIDSQLVEITWIASHFCLLGRWFVALHVEDEGASEEFDFLKAYAETLPPEVIDRNNRLLGNSF